MQVNDLSKTRICPEFAQSALFSPPRGAEHTAKEICQQPALWRTLQQQFLSEKPRLDGFLSPLLAKENLRILLVGAGTSAYIGEALAATLSKQLPLASQRVEAVATTDLVSHPHLYLRSGNPTLLVSYGRSGNSPESMGAIAVCDALLPECFHLLLTCNPNGQMADYGRAQAEHACLWMMPAGSHDKSFAMTSSFSCMYLATLLLFTDSGSEENGSFTRAAAMAEGIVDGHLDKLYQLASLDLSRWVYLGAGPLKGVAQEAALKLLELSAGKIMSVFESPLGFRHGPKSLVDVDTAVVLLASSEPYARAFDEDMADELIRDGACARVQLLKEEDFCNDGEARLDEVWLTLPFILYCQLLAYFKALQLGISPDNPCPGGQVNRVVQGVTLHPLSLYQKPLAGD